MSPHQHGKFGIGVFNAGLIGWLFTRQNSALFSSLFQIRKFFYSIITISAPFTNANGGAWVGIRIANRIFNQAAELRI